MTTPTKLSERLRALRDHLTHGLIERGAALLQRRPHHAAFLIAG